VSAIRWFAAAALALPLVAAACGGSGSDAGGSDSGSEHQTVSVKITDAGCEPAVLELRSGPTTFQVTNDGASDVTEYEVLDGDRILGEAENIAPGLSGQFSLTLDPGEYTTYCPGGTTSERGTLTITGGASGGPSAAALAAVNEYRAYVEDQAAQLVDDTAAFVAAVKAGDVEKAKELYGPARVPYERIEPVAESFGNLDPAIDAREGDVPKASWTGFHPLEKALWVTGNLAGAAALADKLQRDVGRLQARVKTVELQAPQIANGAVELLGEVSKSKITGEEERYSHTDLVDFLANVEGSQAAFDSVKQILAAKNPKLAGEVDQRFADVYAALGQYGSGTDFVLYTQLTKNDSKTLSEAIDVLAEPLSKVSKQVVGTDSR
jgi:iron uptake system component EfeO